jgi:hypothetical protein
MTTLALELPATSSHAAERVSEPILASLVGWRHQDEALLAAPSTAAETRPSTIADDAVLPLAGVVDPDVARFPDEAEKLFDQFGARLRQHDDTLALSLFDLASNTSAEPDARSLALEALTVPRMSRYEILVAQLVRTFLASEVPRLRFSAVAAASDVSPRYRLALGRLIGRLASPDEPSADVRSAACAFLAADAARRG